jgi:hypothetical protein
MGGDDLHCRGKEKSGGRDCVLISASRGGNDDQKYAAGNHRQIGHSRNPMEFSKLNPDWMIRRGCIKRGDVLFQGGSAWNDDKGLGRCQADHNGKKNRGSPDLPALRSSQEKAEERDESAGQSPVKITGDEHPDDPACYVPGIGSEEGRSQGKGEKSGSAYPESEGKIVDNGCNAHELFLFVALSMGRVMDFKHLAVLKDRFWMLRLQNSG